MVYCNQLSFENWSVSYITSTSKVSTSQNIGPPSLSGGPHSEDSLGVLPETTVVMAEKVLSEQ